MVGMKAWKRRISIVGCGLRDVARHRKEERRGGRAVSATVDKVVGLLRGTFVRE